MANRLPIPEKRPLESLTIPGQREAVEGFLSGSSREVFKCGDVEVEITEDPDSHFYGIEGRAPMVKVLDGEGKEILSASVQDRCTHIAQQVADTLKGSGRKGYGSIARDTVEAISGIPPFETARLHYLILFLVKRGYVPAGMIEGHGIGSSHLLYAKHLSLDSPLCEEDLVSIIDVLRKTYGGLKEIKNMPAHHQYEKDRYEGMLRKSAFRNHIRLQYNPKVAQELYAVIQGDLMNFYKKIDALVGKIKKVAYGK